MLAGTREHRHGRIVNVGPLAAWVCEPGEAFYAASKAALARYTESLRHEVWRLGVHVSLVVPGAFTTGGLRTAAAPAVIADYDGPREDARRTLHAAPENAGSDKKPRQVECGSGARFPLGSVIGVPGSLVGVGFVDP